MSASGSSGIDKPHIYTGTDLYERVCVSFTKVTKISVCFATTKIEKTNPKKKKEGWGAESSVPQKTQNIFTIHQEVLTDRSFRRISIHTLPWYNIPFMQSYFSELFLLLVHIPKLETVKLLLFSKDEPQSSSSLHPPTSRVSSKNKRNRNTSAVWQSTL